MNVAERYGDVRLCRVGAFALSLALLAATYAVLQEHHEVLLLPGAEWPPMLALAIATGLLVLGRWRHWAFAGAATAAAVLSGVSFPLMPAIFVLLRSGRYRTGSALALLLALSGLLNDRVNVLMLPDALASNVAHGVVETVMVVLAALLANRQEQLAAAREELRALAERDRAQRLGLRLAEMAHDGVGHRISLMLLQVGAIESAAGPGQETVRARCGVVFEAGQAAMAELSQVVGVLREGEGPSAVAGRTGRPGLSDLGALVDVYRLHEQEIDLRCDWPPGRVVPPEVQEAAYRSVEEGLSNVLRHAAGALTRVDCAEHRDRRTLVVEVLNSAPPERSPTAPGGPGIRVGTGTGLAALAGRIAALDGTLTARPTPDGGHLLRAELPLFPAGTGD
ncbi:histidine kinase [Kitasatospora sp. NPDC089797]|uniref:sensor histidine kinase n=1 Tax=Kitasatospora sp. NPDC089797 TaxID=3155298 RepID=UPI003438C26B